LDVKSPPSLAAAVKLVVHIGVATVLFSAITAAAVFLNWITKLCERLDLAPGWAIQGMHALEFVLWAGDVICFLLLVAVEVLKFCRTIWGGWTE
jgi:hypothetical protein